MTVLIMAIVGFAVGFALDEIMARLAREPYERGEVDEDDLRLKKHDGPTLDFSSEHGAFAMPRALTTSSPLRRVGVVAATALIFALVARAYDGDALHLAIVAAYASALIVCTGTDIFAFRVPNVITYPAILGALALGLLMPDVGRGEMLAGGFLTGGTFFVMSVATRGGMGLGDVKLAFFTGFALGLELGVRAMLITAIAGGAVALVLMLTRARDRRDPIPYAPFIAAGALYVMLTQGTAFASI